MISRKQILQIRHACSLSAHLSAIGKNQYGRAGHQTILRLGEKSFSNKFEAEIICKSYVNNYSKDDLTGKRFKGFAMVWDDQLLKAVSYLLRSGDDLHVIWNYSNSHESMNRISWSVDEMRFRIFRPTKNKYNTFREIGEIPVANLFCEKHSISRMVKAVSVED